MLRVQRNDPRALETLYDRHNSAVFWLAMRILNDRGLAADATQEAFLGLWRSRALYRPGRGRVKWWLMSIARNCAIDVRRRQRDILPHDESLIDRLAAPALTEHDVLAADERRHLDVQIARLPPDQREVIQLAFFAGLTHPEITRRLGIPLGTIKGRIRLALEKLRHAP